MAKEFNFEKIAVLGTGVLGSQIVMQVAWHGKEVYAYDAFPAALEKLPKRWEWIRQGYERHSTNFTDERWEESLKRIHPTSDLKEAVGDVDLVIEAVPENLDLKKETWEKVGALADERTILATNTSSLLPSDFSAYSGHEDRFLTIHFANEIWKHNSAEIMGTVKTDADYINGAIQFAKETGLVPLHVRKEQPGYFLNSLLIPWLDAAAKLYVNGIAEPADIDKAWTIATGTDAGPFRVYDVVGFNVASNISAVSKDPEVQAFGAELKKAIADGFSGVIDGKGFYLYDEDGEPTGQNPFWLKK